MRHADETADPREGHFAVNAFGISAVEFFWGLGLPVVVESTFLQLFLEHIGASPRVIGLVPGVFAAGIALFSMTSSYLTTHLAMKRRAVVLAHMAASTPLIGFGAVLLAGGYGVNTVTLFLGFYLLYAMGIGVTLPVWQSFLVKIFSERMTVPGLSVMMVFQIAGRLLGSLVILKIVRAFAFSAVSAGASFLGIGLMFFASSLLFLLVRERDGEGRGDAASHNLRTLIAAFRDIVTQRNFILFMLSTLESYACISVISFYANYAVNCHDVDRGIAAGLFVACIYAGAITATLAFGWFDLLALKAKFIVSKLFAVAAVVLLLAAQGLPHFLAASLLLGCSRGISLLGFSPAVKRLSGRSDATDYFSLSPVLALPFSIGIPLLCGGFMERYAGNGGAAYRAMFAGLGLLVLLSLVFVSLADFGSSRQGSGECDDPRSGQK
ncbi:MAG: hypothetical protein JXA20_11600 [Spirochaetes bacterium]|nr:hypothetical protein [Spirochaetota bacterium]